MWGSNCEYLSGPWKAKSPPLEVLVVLDMVSRFPKRKSRVIASVTRWELPAFNARHMVLFHVSWIVDYVVDSRCRNLVSRPVFGDRGHCASLSPLNGRRFCPYFHGPNSVTQSLSRSNCRLTFVSGRQLLQSRFVPMNTSLAESAYLATISSLKAPASRSRPRVGQL